MLYLTDQNEKITHIPTFTMQVTLHRCSDTRTLLMTDFHSEVREEYRNQALQQQYVFV